MKTLMLLATLAVAFLVAAAAADAAPFHRCGLVSFYGEESGAVTASGERFDPNGRTIAIWGVRFGTMLRVTDVRTGRSVIVRANDTGGFRKYGRIGDVSKGAARALGIIERGVARVCIRSPP